MSKYLLEIKDVSKSFPGVRALSDVSIMLEAGEIIAFVGENGAGKSTLLKILSGDYTADTGTVNLDGLDVSRSTPRRSMAAGFRLVRQEPEIVPDVTVAENIFIGELPLRRSKLVDFSAMRRIATELLTRYGFADLIDINASGRSLSPAQMQIVEIIRALKDGVKVIAFDEPTSSLTKDETERLFVLIKQLKTAGLGVIYVSHRLAEITRISDRVVILKDGELAATRTTAAVTEDEIVRLMVGRDLRHGFRRTETSGEAVVLDVENVSSRWHRNVSFQIRAGEILGFAGLVGAGRTELAKVIFGEYSRSAGTIRIDGRVANIRSPADAIAAKIGFAPENRKVEGLILVRSVIENASMAVYGTLSRLGFLRDRAMTNAVAPFIRSLDVKTPSVDQEVGKLSGGNQQKVVLARWLAAGPKVLILDEPTRAVDVGAKAEIYRLIDTLAAQGMAIMLISSEMPELLALSDRIVVMHEGTLSAPVEKADATEERILNLALGKRAA